MISASTRSNGAAKFATAWWSVKSSVWPAMPGSEMSRRAAAWTLSPASRNARAVARPMPDERADHDHASRFIGARKTLNSGGGGPPASRANCSGPSSSGRTSGRSSPSVACAAHQPLVGLLEVGHRVRVGALDAVLAADHAVEAERRVVGGEADADQRPAGAQQLEAERAGGLRADRVEHQVGLARVLGLLGRRVDGVGAERGGARPPLVLRLDDRDVQDAVQQRGLQRHEADRAGAEHDGALDAAVGQPHGVDAVGQRLHQRADAGGDAVGQHARVGRADLHEVGERARDVHADQHAVLAQVREARAAQPALAAAGERVDRHPRAVELLRALAGRDDGARRTRGPSPAAASGCPCGRGSPRPPSRRSRPPRAAGSARRGPGSRRVRRLLDVHRVRPIPHQRPHTTSTVFTSSPSPVIAIRTSSPPRSVNSIAGITDVPVSSTTPTREVLRLEQPARRARPARA